MEIGNYVNAFTPSCIQRFIKIHMLVGEENEKTYKSQNPSNEFLIFCFHFSKNMFYFLANKIVLNTMVYVGGGSRQSDAICYVETELGKTNILADN